MDTLTLLVTINAASSGAVIFGVFKFVRHIARVELKVDTMWEEFIRRFDYVPRRDTLS